MYSSVRITILTEWNDGNSPWCTVLAREYTGSFGVFMMFALLFLSCLMSAIYFRHDLLMWRLSMLLLTFLNLAYQEISMPLIYSAECSSTFGQFFQEALRRMLRLEWLLGGLRSAPVVVSLRDRRHGSTRLESERYRSHFDVSGFSHFALLRCMCCGLIKKLFFVGGDDVANRELLATQGLIF